MVTIVALVNQPTTQQIVRAELLIVALIENSLGHNHLGDWGYLR